MHFDDDGSLLSALVLLLRWLLRLSAKEDARRWLGVGMVARHRRPEVVSRGK